MRHSTLERRFGDSVLLLCHALRRPANLGSAQISWIDVVTVQVVPRPWTSMGASSGAPCSVQSFPEIARTLFLLARTLL